MLQRYRLCQQLDQDKNVKEKVTVSFQELDQVQNMLSSIGSDFKRKFPGHMKKPGAQFQPQNPQYTPMQQQQSQQAHQQRLSQQAAAPNAQAAQQAQSQPAPLSTENLQIHQKMSKNHQIAANKSSQPPTGPTPAQATFQIGGASPHGEPTYANKPTITQESLHLPPRKRAKKDAASLHQAQAASPQLGKAQSPDLRKQMPQEVKAPQKTSFVCPYSGCEMQTIGFEDERSLKTHVIDEHDKPNQDPIKFAFNCLGEALGLEPSGQDKNASPTAQAGPKAGQLPIKTEVSSTPMSREASSMKRQGSGNAGGKAAEATPGKAEVSSDMTMSKLPKDPWAGATIDPQTISSIFKPLSGAGNGAISDPSLTLYRSLTPNDTPESIKDSGSSEPNSDISESANLEIDVAINNLVDPDMISDLNLVNLGAIEDAENEQSNFSKSLFSDIPPLDDVTLDFSKPFDMNTLMNTGLYALNFN